MAKITFILSVFLIVALLLGCTTAPEPISTPLPSPAPTALTNALPALEGEWFVTINQSGGIMGMSRTLKISSDGDLTFEDRGGNRSRQDRISPEKLAELAELVSAVRYTPVPVETGCADCFIFNIEITSPAGEFQAQLNQLDLPDSGLEPLVIFLVSNLNRLAK